MLRAAALAACVPLCGVARAGEGKSPDEITQWIEDGYRAGDPAYLDVFLDEWRRSTPPTPDDVIARKPAFERALYEAFPVFYHVPRMKPGLWVVCPQELSVCLVDGDVVDIWREPNEVEARERLEPLVVSEFTVSRFRPRVDVPAERLVYADERYLVPLLAFLSQQRPHGAAEQFWTAPNRGEEARARLRYVGTRLPAYAGHWGHGWHLVTCPIPGRAYMNLEATQMVISYRRGYGGGEVLLKKLDGDWTFLEEGIGWIE